MPIMPLIMPLPDEGRVFRGHCQVRLGDALPSRRARLDALARYLQDVAEDDAADAGLPDTIGWVLRKTRLTVPRFPELGERLRLETFCSATAAKWAERTTTLTGDRGALAQGVSVWVAIDVATGRPARPGERFERVYGPSARGRRASARLHLPAPPPPAAVAGRPWPLRVSDFDVWGHVNNAVSWAAVEEALGAVDWLPEVAEVEHNEALSPGAAPVLAEQRSDDALDLWLLDPRRVTTSARARGPAAG